MGVDVRVRVGVIVGVAVGVGVGGTMMGCPIGVEVGVGVAVSGVGCGVAEAVEGGVGTDGGVWAAVGVAVCPGVGVGLGLGVDAQSSPAIRIASAPLIIEAEDIFPASEASTVPVFTTALRSRDIESAPSHRACASSTTPETCGAAMEVPLMYT